jgi:hypothetical protein
MNNFESGKRSLDIELRLRKLDRYRYLPSLRAASQKEVKIIRPDSAVHSPPEGQRSRHFQTNFGIDSEVAVRVPQQMSR